MAHDKSVGVGFYVSASVLFAASLAATAYFCISMSGAMAMPGGWSMSMAWMRMPGQSWPAAAGMYMTMWLAMMVAMMGPAILPMLQSGRRAGASISLIAGGYFFVYAVMGAGSYPVGLLVASAAMRWPAVSRAIPFVAGGALVIAGGIQWTSWKRACLLECRSLFGGAGPPSAESRWEAWRWGTRLGLSCASCCSGLMLSLFALGMMDPWVIVILTGAIALERLTPRPESITRISGIAAILTGLIMLTRSLLHLR